MNAIKYIEKKLPLIESYFELKYIDSLVYHTQYKKMESGTNLWILEKNQVQTLEEAMLIQILVNEMKYGNYHFTEKDETDVLKLNLSILNERYKSIIEENSGKSLKLLFEDYGEPADIVNMNYNWSIQIDLNKIKSEKCFSEPITRSFKLLEEWNDVDYIFETQNYFVRLNWSTAA